MDFHIIFILILQTMDFDLILVRILKTIDFDLILVLILLANTKFLGLPNWTRPTASSNLAVLGIFLIQLFPNWTACSPITYTNKVKIDSL